MRQSNGRGREPDVPKLVIAVGAVVAVVVLDVLGLFNGAGAVMVGLFALVATVVGVRMHRPSRSWPWWMIAGALSLFIAGAIARNAMHTLANLGPTRPLVPDIIVLPGYALLAIGLLGFSRGSGGRHRFGITLDGTIAALSILACAWVFVIDPVLFTHQTPMASRLALSAYPPASIFLVVITLRIAFSPVQERVASYWFLLIAMTSMFIGDTLYMFVDIDIAHVPTQLLVLPYCIAFLAAGATALDPSMRMLTEPRDTYARTSGARIIITAVALAIPAFLTRLVFFTEAEISSQS